MAKSWIGQSVTLKCVSDGFPIPAVTWIKPDGNIIKKVNSKENTVTVVMTADQDFGFYNCTTNNGVGDASTRTVQVQQISKSIIR